jgi:hypothetical protein
MKFIQLLLTTIVSITSVGAMALDARDRGFISRGMHEGEVLFKIGKPDHEAFILNVKGQPEQKTWTYFPHPRDAEMLTIITFRSGVVAQIERKIAR